jgi:hypothetical protein
MNTKLTFALIMIFGLLIIGCDGDDNITDPTETTTEAITELEIETFTFSSDGTDINGKIFLPTSFSKEKSLPVIYLIDFTDQHFANVKDEFKTVISATTEVPDLNAVVVTLEKQLDVDADTESFQEYYPIFKNMTSYVDVNYSSNTSRTFIGRGSEAGIVLMTLFLEDSVNFVFENFIATDSPSNFNSEIIDMINGGDFPKNKLNKKLHFSFSSSNDHWSCTSMINEINEAEYTWLQFESVEYAGGYENTYRAAFEAGIKFIFSQ